MEISGKCNNNIEFEKRIENYLGNFTSKFKIVIWGSGKSCEILINTIRDTHTIKYIVDIDKNKWGKEILGYKIKSPDEIKNENLAQIRIMIMPYTFARYDIIKQLNGYGLNDESFCFGNDYLVLHNFKYSNKIVFQSLGFFIGSACNLKCVDCIAHLPFYKKNINTFVPLKTIKEDIDNAFKKIDFINLITLSTGEIFLHPEINEIFLHLYKYKNQYNFIQSPINGTNSPKKSTLEIMKRCDIGVYISDYSHTIGKKSRIPKIIDIFEEYNVRYELFNDLQGGKAEAPIWSDIGDFSIIRKRTDQETAKIYQNCANRAAQVLFKNKLYTCGSAQWGEFGGLYSPTEDDFTNILENNNIELLRTYFGATPKGFPSVCNRCDGIGPYSNKKTVLAGIQV